MSDDGAGQAADAERGRTPFEEGKPCVAAVGRHNTTEHRDCCHPDGSTVPDENSNTAQNGTERSVTYAYYILMITRGEYRGTFYIENTALTDLYLTIHKTTRRNENDSR